MASANLKPSVLELGGSDPFIIFNDATIPNAIENGVSARFSNNGQTCISAKRFLVQDDIFESVLDQFSNHLEKQLHYANPLSPETTIGPMARLDLKTQVLNQLDRSNIQKDAIKYSYQPPKQQGYFVAPMVIDGRNLAINNPLNTEEVFGPIAVFNSFLKCG